VTNLLTSWKENRATFGSGVEWSNQKVAYYYALLLIGSAAISVVSDRPSDEFFNATLTAISIIAGFTFNALIFFVDHKFVVQRDPHSLEQEAAQAKIDRLASGSFSVLYYFTLISFFVIVMCVLALVMPSISENFPQRISKNFYITEVAGRALFFAALAEALVTFFRAIRRLRYLFGKVREAQ
jgi:uncharacterized membrane protein